MSNPTRAQLDEEMLEFYNRVQDRKAGLSKIQKERPMITTNSIVLERPQEDVQPAPPEDQLRE